MRPNRNQENSHVCPWWFIWTFDNPLRSLMHDPEMILEGLIEEGDTVLDIGCGAGFFSIPLARLAGESGKVIAADLQEKMLSQVARRAKLFGVSVHLHQCGTESIGLEEQLDAAVAFWMVHEVPSKRDFLKELYQLLKPGGKLLVAEPKVHVSQRSFEKLLSIAVEVGFTIESKEGIRFSRSAVLCKPIS